MKSNLLLAPYEEILANPRYFPVKIDFGRDCLTLVETSRELLAAAPFLDGRSPFADGDAIEVPLSSALRASWPSPARPDRFVFNVAFCGSTLLSTVLGVEGYSFAQREPGVLVDLANSNSFSPGAVFDETMTLVRALLRRSWRPGERNICKPPSWANNLIPLLTKDPEQVRPLFLVTSQHAFLQAIFRGGRSRIEYIVNATDHLLRKTASDPNTWTSAAQDVGDPLEVVARLALLSLHVQLELFDQAMARGGWGEAQLMSFDRIAADPAEACRAAAAALGVAIPRARLDESVSRYIGLHAKMPGLAYCAESLASRNRDVEREHGRVIGRALDWAAMSGLKGECRAMAA